MTPIDTGIQQSNVCATSIWLQVRVAAFNFSANFARAHTQHTHYHYTSSNIDDIHPVDKVS